MRACIPFGGVLGQYVGIETGNITDIGQEGEIIIWGEI
jgi:hypothetical protein